MKRFVFCGEYLCSVCMLAGMCRAMACWRANPPEDAEAGKVAIICPLYEQSQIAGRCCLGCRSIC